MPAGGGSPMGQGHESLQPHLGSPLGKDPSLGTMPIETGVKTRGRQDLGGKRAEFVADSPAGDRLGTDASPTKKQSYEHARKAASQRKGSLQKLFIISLMSIALFLYIIKESSHVWSTGSPSGEGAQRKGVGGGTSVLLQGGTQPLPDGKGGAAGRTEEEEKRGGGGAEGHAAVAGQSTAGRAAAGRGGRQSLEEAHGEGRGEEGGGESSRDGGAVGRNAREGGVEGSGRSGKAKESSPGSRSGAASASLKEEGLSSAEEEARPSEGDGANAKGGGSSQSPGRAASSGPEPAEKFTCDRSHWRTDVCSMKGDVRVDARTALFMLYPREEGTPRGEEKVKPYTRKWESSVMEGVEELSLRSVDPPPGLPHLPPMAADEADSAGEQGGAAQRGGSKGARSQRRRQRQRRRRRRLLAEEGAEEKGEGGRIPIDLPQGDGRALSGPGGETSYGRMVRKMTSRKAEERQAMRAKRLSMGVTQLMFLEVQRREEEAEARERGEALQEEEGERGWRVPRWGGEPPLNRSEDGTPLLPCDVRHRVPAVAFSTAGYTGNLYHEFHDGLIPLYITSQHLDGEVVFIVVQPHVWWFTKYEHVLRQMSKYPAVLLGQDSYVHCFPEVTVGLRIHDELTVDPKQMPNGGSIEDFQLKLKQAWKGWPYKPPPPEGPLYGCKPLLSIIARDSTRALSNQAEVVGIAEEEGYWVRVLRPVPTTALQDMWHQLQDSNAMLGVHGAGMTHFLFMRPKAAYVQVVPLGTDWAAKTYYGDPAIRLGLQYTEYKVTIEESSLSQKYPKDDPVLTNPQSVLDKGWWAGKEIYLEGQNVTLDPHRIRAVLKDMKAQLKNDPLYVKQQAKAARSKQCQQALKQT